MKHVKKVLAVAMCLSLFAAMAMGSTESDGTKEIGDANGGSKTKTTI